MLRRRTIDNLPHPAQHAHRMTKLCIFVGTAIGSYLGWYLGSRFGGGLGWTFTVSSIGSLAGVYAGWKVGQKFE